MSTNKKSHLYDYLDYVKMAKLDCKSKALLYFYATSYNWTQNKPSWYSQRSICALVSMAPSTYHAVQKKLESLGWIRTHYRGRDKTVQVWVSIGSPDPDYESFSWSTWHPFNLGDDLNTETYPDHDPFEHRDSFEPNQKPTRGLYTGEEDLLEPEEDVEERAAREAFWASFEDPHSSVASSHKTISKHSESKFDDLASALWGV